MPDQPGLLCGELVYLKQNVAMQLLQGRGRGLAFHSGLQSHERLFGGGTAGAERVDRAIERAGAGVDELHELGRAVLVSKEASPAERARPMNPLHA